MRNQIIIYSLIACLGIGLFTTPIWLEYLFMKSAKEADYKALHQYSEVDYSKGFKLSFLNARFDNDGLFDSSQLNNYIVVNDLKDVDFKTIKYDRVEVYYAANSRYDSLSHEQAIYIDEVIRTLKDSLNQIESISRIGITIYKENNYIAERRKNRRGQRVTFDNDRCIVLKSYSNRN